MTDSDVVWRFSPGVMTWRVLAIAQVGDWSIRAEWVGISGKAALPKGPSRVELRPGRQAPRAVKVRGVTASCLREMEAVVTQLSKDFAERPELDQIADPLAPILKRLGQMTDGPRGNPDFYPMLLKAFRNLETAGHPEPVNALADAMSVSKNTAKTRLRLARKHSAAWGQSTHRAGN
jgi:hypothetical protein